jgi:NAD(P)H-dependent FMN reductase
MENLNVMVILGSTREGRFGDKPAHWILGELKKKDGINAELLDLRDYPLPFYNDTTSPAQRGGKYPDAAVQKWADKIASADAFVMISPEYNHGYSAVIKNALDVLSPEWALKPVGFIGYGSAGGSRAIEQLRQVVIELGMAPIKNSLAIPGEVYMAAMKLAAPVDPALFEPVRKSWAGDKVEMFLGELAFMGRTLKTARQAVK